MALWFNQPTTTMYKYHQLPSLVAAALAAVPANSTEADDVNTVIHLLNSSGSPEEDALNKEAADLALELHNQLADHQPVVAFMALAAVMVTSGQILMFELGTGNKVSYLLTGRKHRAAPVVMGGTADEKRERCQQLAQDVAGKPSTLESREDLRRILGYFGVDTVSEVPAESLNELEIRLREHLNLRGYRVGTPHPSSAAADDGPIPSDEDDNEDTAEFEAVVNEGFEAAKAAFVSSGPSLTPYQPGTWEDKAWQRGAAIFVGLVQRERNGDGDGPLFAILPDGTRIEAGSTPKPHPEDGHTFISDETKAKAKVATENPAPTSDK